MLLTRQYPKWFNVTVTALMLVGTITVCYLLFHWGMRLVEWSSR